MKNLFTLLLLTTTLSVFAQIHDPVKWETTVEKISDSEYELVATATIEGEWHLYSQSVPEDGPIPTTFTFQSNPNYLKKGNTKEGEGTTVDDKVFDMRIKYFGHKAAFKQRIKLRTKNTFKVDATVEFMVCNDTQCLPPTEVDLEFEVN
ncbi:protein-disulfide reductase DsbD domain-containing protein [Maribacter sp. 2304DJ31-5]|uniref:protein-disulfide reductase DsbD domain-containing protein n=1 Tax=Maribacter sp. 2304DJ31-5 TaxID=3386273 RepID=UPI0039BCEEFF